MQREPRRKPVHAIEACGHIFDKYRLLTICFNNVVLTPGAEYEMLDAVRYVSTLYFFAPVLSRRAPNARVQDLDLDYRHATSPRRSKRRGSGSVQ